MKKALLLIGSVVVSLSASAQNFTGKWERPADPEFSDFEPETKYYMWNVGAKGFYINHQNGTGEPYYGTAASVNDTIGALVHFTKTNPDEKIVEAWEPGTDNTYLLVSVVSTKKNQELCTFADPDYRVWTDNNTKGYRYFDVAVNGKTFTITPNPTMIQMVVAGELPADYAYNPLGVESTNVNKIVNTSHGEGEWYTDWAFVTEDAYEAYLSSAKEQIKRCAAAEALRKTIENAVKEYPGINLDNQVDVYNNTNSTLEELTAAKEAISDVIVAFTASKATIDNPVNYSSLIKNSTFDVLGNFDGWSHTGSVTFGAGGTYKSTNAEVYGKSFDVYQTVKGLPTGVYIAKVNAYFRKENAQKDYNDYAAGVQSDCNFYAQSGEFKSSVSIKHVAEGGVNEAFGVNDEVTFETNDGVTMYVPNSMLAADSYFHNEDGTINPRYENVVYVPVTNGELTIGVANSVGGGADWSIFDDFQLYYIGDADECYELLKKNLGKALEYALPQNTAYSTRDYADYTNAKAAFNTATGKAALTEYTNAAAALETVKAGVENYKLYQVAIEDANKWYEDAEKRGVNEEIPAVAKIISYLTDDEDDEDFGFPNGTYMQILNEDTNEGALTNEQIVAETAFVNELVKQAMNDGIVEGADLTAMITNPGFEIAGGKGWTNANGALTNWHGGSDKNYCAEAWNSNFNVYQDVEGLPNGLYEVSVQAFYRTAANATAYEAFQNDPDMKADAKVLSYVYLNEFATPVRNVMEIQFDSNLANNCFQTPAGTYTLNGMASASEAFSLEDESQNFTMKVYGIIKDGKMRLGIRGEGTTFDRWTLWDNFKLRYMGKNKVAVASVLKTKGEALLAMQDEVDENEKPIMNSYTKSFINAQCESALNLLSGIAEFNDETLAMLDENDLWNALTNIAAAQEEVDADVQAYKAFRSTYSTFETVDSENFTQEMIKEFYAINDLIENAENMTRQQLEELSARINKAMNWFTYPTRLDNAVEPELPEGYDTATGDVDFTSIIINPDFEEDLNGWNNNNMQSQTNTAFGKNGNTYCEKWHADLSLSISQSFKNLPNGFYTLTANCYNSTADGCLFISAEDENCNVTETTKFIEDTTTPETVNTYSVTFEYNGGILTIGAKATLTSSTWFCVDNFILTYSKERPTAVETVETATTSAPAGIYTISGARVDKLAKGINIVKMADGSVRKVFVK